MAVRLLRSTALLGLITPLWFGLLVIVLGQLQPGYSHRDQYISELGAAGAPHAGWLNYLGIFWFGLALLVFIPAFYRLVQPGRRARVACALLALTGIGLLLLAQFPCDAGCSLVNPSITAQVHNTAAISTFIAMIAVTATLGVRSFSGGHSDVYYRFCLLIAFLLTLCFIKIMLMGYQVPYAGLFQRVFIGLFSLWLMVTAWLVWQGIGRQQD